MALVCCLVTFVGDVSIDTLTVKGYSGLLAARFFLGLAECGVLPGKPIDVHCSEQKQ